MGSYTSPIDPLSIPAFEVKREEFIDSVQFRGEVKAMKSLTISAPAEAGDLQILKIATSGVDVKKGDLIVEFDKSKTEQDMRKTGPLSNRPRQKSIRSGAVAPH